jgi:hypothetical protein
MACLEVYQWRWPDTWWSSVSCTFASGRNRKSVASLEQMGRNLVQQLMDQIPGYHPRIGIPKGITKMLCLVSTTCSCRCSPGTTHKVSAQETPPCSRCDDTAPDDSSMVEDDEQNLVICISLYQLVQTFGTSHNVSLWLLVFLYHSAGTLLGNSREHQCWMQWRGCCMIYHSLIIVGAGVSCGNFYSRQRPW